MKKIILSFIAGLIIGLTAISIVYSAGMQKEFFDFSPRAVKAICLVVMDEINILRVKAGLQERTMKQFYKALETKEATIKNDSMYIAPEE